MIDERKNVPTTPSRTYCKRSRPLPYSNPNKQDAPELEVYPAPSHHPTTPLFFLIVYIHLKWINFNGKKKLYSYWSLTITVAVVGFLFEF